MNKYERNFKEMLSRINPSDESAQQVTNISNNMTFQMQNYKRIIDLWIDEFFQSEQRKQWVMLRIVSDVLVNTQRMPEFQQYIIGFGDKFQSIFKRFIPCVESVEFLEGVRSLCDLWEDKKIYAPEFMNYLRSIVNMQIQLSTNKNYLAEKELSDYNDYLAGTEIELNESQKEVERIYALNKLESLTSRLSELKQSGRQGEETNLQLKSLLTEVAKIKETLLSDLVKRESFIYDLSLIITKEKEEYFKLDVTIQKMIQENEDRLGALKSVNEKCVEDESKSDKLVVDQEVVTETNQIQIPSDQNDVVMA